MNVFEFAMQMELDGKEYYLESKEKVDSPELKKILQELADDEQKHYIIFKAMKDGGKAEYVESEATKILSSVRNIFVDMKDKNDQLTFADDAKNVWEHAREVEKKAEAFYREEAEKLNNKEYAVIFNKIADEEHKHWVTMDNVIKFLERPTSWLEDAEWNNLEEY